MTAIHRTRAVPTPQWEQDDPTQVQNSAGGYVYALSPEKAFERFLILGTEGGTYYAKERDLTKQAMALVAQCVQDLDVETYFGLVEEAARTAPKRTWALYALAEALISGTPAHKARVPHAAKNVVQTGTDLFELASYVRGRRGWGETVRHTFDAFLAEMDVQKLALWSVKYRERFGYTWRDLLRLQHTKPDSLERQGVFQFMNGKLRASESSISDLNVPDVIIGYLMVQGLAAEDEIISLVGQYHLPWEALTDEQRTDLVWKACLPNIGDRAVLRNMASFTRRGLDQDYVFRQNVTDRINRSSKLHPINVLDALKTYGSGGAVGRSRGGTYVPNSRWQEALEDALDHSWVDGVTKTGQRVMIGVDVSGSMGAPAGGSAVLTCAEVAGALSLAFVKAEEEVGVFAFNEGLQHLPFTRKTAYADVMKRISHINYGGTDCSLPMLYAMQQKVKVDTFISITDSETWAGSVQPMEALRQYRQASGIHAKMAVIGLTSNGFSIADPRDRATMDFVGFSSDLPKAIEKFMLMT